MAEKITRVLLVDDDEDDFIITSDYLQQISSHTFDIEWISTPTLALEVLQNNHHDICLLDYQLGVINGLTVLENAIKNGCTIPIIMLTGQSDSTVDNHALDAGAVDYLIKNEMNITRFTRTIRYALARKDIENERLERLKAETKNRSKDKFLAHLSHELRTPLTSILGYTELLLNSPKTNAFQTELHTIANNGKHLLGLLNNVLDLSKIAAGKLELNYSKIPLNMFIANIINLMKISAKDKGLSLNVIAKKVLPTTIYGDPVRLRQILINIIHNAIKFTEQGSITLTLWTEVIEHTEMLCFDITDTGLGMPEPLINNIFKPFEQIEDAVSRKEEGAGLGLAICAELVKVMNGSIKVTSKINSGSNFRIKIYPGDVSNVKRDLLTFSHDYKALQQNSYVSLKGNILVVDDIQDIRQLIGYFSESFGLTVSYAENGQVAIEKIIAAQQNNTPYDLVLMDIHMPKLDGKRAITQLRSLGITLPIMAITAATMKGVRKELTDIGFNDIIAKPIEKSTLYERVSHFLPCRTTEDDNSNNPTSAQQRIIVVDDDNDTVQVTALLLNSLNVQVKTAQNATECMGLLSCEQAFNIALLDLNLPGINGLQLAKNIKNHYPNIKIIMLSGSEIPLPELQKHGAQQALLKPINLNMLKSII